MHWKIGAFSRFTRVSIKMLRHYDERGLLRPAAVDQATGYRYYLADQLPRLNRILALKDMGFSLDEVAALLDDARPASDEAAMLLRRRVEIETYIREEQRRLAQVDARLASIAAGQPSHDVVLRPVAAHLAATIRAVVSSDGPDVAALFDEAETFAAQHGVRAVSSPLMLLHKLVSGAQAVEVAVPLTRVVPPAGSVVVRELPPLRQAACVVYCGSYSQTQAAVHALESWAATNGMCAAGPTREVYLRFGADENGYRLPAAFLGDDAATYVTEVQLPVAERGTP
jgi:DNA-binding transcriptional MerR regulator